MIVVVVFVFAGIFCWQYFYTQKQIEISEERTTEIEKLEKQGDDQEKIIEDEIADWKIYRNNEYGFEIKYPQVYDTENYIECRGKTIEEKDEIINL